MSRAARPTRSGFRAAAGLAAAGLIACGLFFATTPWARGYAIYHGYVALPGRIAGHDKDLPSRATRCSNCHDAISGNGLTQRVITPLTRQSLGESQSRRNGPPSAYDAARFCSALRDGIDPSMIQIERTMPRFTATAGDCAALWAFVSSR